MALANTRVRHFQNMNDLLDFVQNDANISSIVQIFQDNSGQYVLVYDIT